MSIINIGVSECKDKILVLKVRMLNVDAIMGLLVPIFTLFFHFFGVIELDNLILNCLFSTILASILVFVLNAFKHYDIANVFFLLYFLFVLLLLSLNIGKFACIHFLLIPIGISGFIYFLGRPYFSFLFFSVYLGLFTVLFFMDFFQISHPVQVDAITLNFIRKVCVVCVFIILFYKMFVLVLMYEGLLQSSQESEVWFRNVYDYSPVGIVVSDKKGNVLNANTTLCKSLGYATKDIVGQSVKRISYPDDQEHERNAAKDIWAGKKDNYKIEKRFVKSNGEVLWSNLSLVAIRNDEKEVSYVVGMIEDITDRKKKEQIIEANIKKLNTKNQELEKYIESNMQLENFAYIASHDLKEPLCSIQGLVDLFEYSAQERLNEEEKSYIEMLKISTENMQNLIRDLLMYSRVNAQPLNIDIANIPKLLQLIQFDLRNRIKETNAKILVDNLPIAINADVTRIRQLLQNLITNGLKFQKEGVQPVVKISCTDTKREWIFEVSDNGIGISSEFHEKIFLLFRRLHSRSEFEGTGIGLAICKKIVELHKGRIWLESTDGKGTSFFFSISKQIR